MSAGRAASRELLVPLAMLLALAGCGGDARSPAPDSSSARNVQSGAAALGGDAGATAPRDDAASSSGASGSESRDLHSCVAPAADAWSPAAMGAATFVVNRGTRGMSSTLRWMLSPDSAAIVVMDPVGVEAEPIPDGVLYATERTGRTWRMDSVWSAAPSPDWRRIAFGRAVFLRGGEEQRIPASAWEAPARALRTLARDAPELSAESLRAHSYPASGMGVAEGAGVAMVVDLDSLPIASPQFAALDGWRVAWSCDARSLHVGDRPRRVQNDEPASSMSVVAYPRGATISRAPIAPLRWTMGPTLTIGVPFDTSTGPLSVRGRTIEAKAGRVVLRETDGAGHTVERDVGPGVPLAATRGGRFVLAVAPRPNAGQHESPHHAVVYRVP